MSGTSGLGRLVGGVVGVLVACVVLVVCAPVAWAGFGLESFDLSLTNRDGSFTTQAGSAPYAFTTVLKLNRTGVEVGVPESGVPDGGNAREIRAVLPVGISGDPGAVVRCTEKQFGADDGFGNVACPNSSAVGVVRLELPGFSIYHPVYNLVPSPGIPAQIGFAVAGGIVVRMNATVRTGGDYGLTVIAPNIEQAVPLRGARLTVWGVPGDPSHNSERGTCENLFGPTGELCPDDVAPEPFLMMPTSCSAGPLPVNILVDSWQEPDVFVTGLSGNPTGVDGCNRLDFSPSFGVAADSTVAGSPSGVQVGVHIPQNQDPSGLAEAHLRNAVVTLPQRVVVNPSAANGLGACTPAEIGLDNATVPSCPDSAKVGTVEVDTPVLDTPLEGSLYVAQQGDNPFGSLLALYLVAEGDGVLIKVPGEVRLDPVTGQVTTVFQNLPQQPFSDVKLSLFGGPGAALSLPTGCGTFAASAQLTPYSRQTPSELSSAIPVTSGCSQGFSPAFTAGTTSNQAGGFSPFTVTLSRSDQDQNLAGVTVKTPPGLLGILKSVERCGEPQASQGACGQGSLIGHTTVAAGAGPDPVWVQGGQVFLTGPYKGAPFGLSIVMPAKAGPFDLGTVVVRAAINVDPRTAQITIASDPLPRILQGVPLQIKTVNVTVDRAGFIFNPTNCEPLTVGGTLTSTQGASANVSSRFQASNCAGLGFHPSFTVSTQGKGSKANGVGLDVKVGYPQGAQANLAKVAVSLPKQLPSRLSTIQQACPEATFAQNPASCPVGSNVGTATASTPILAGPVTGPAYLVSHGGAAFPDLVLILQGEGVTLDLVGAVNIRHGITSSTFASVPDAPIGGFELKLPQGPHSALGTNLPAKAKGSLCGQSLVMPTTLTGQNGAVVKQSTKIKVTGCAKAKAKKKARKRGKGKAKVGKGGRKRGS